MRKIIAILLAVMMIVTTAVTAQASTPHLPIPDMPKVPDIGDDIDFGIDFGEIIRRWIKENPIGIVTPVNPGPVTPEPTEPEIIVTELDAPIISSAKYVHRYFQRLEIKWNTVENAESYLIEITKADGAVETFNTIDNMMYLTDADCPKVYIEETATWASAYVRVAAVAGDVTSEWSDAKKIGCDKIH